MSNLFIRLYLDEDVNVLVADLLNARGFDVLTVRDARKLQASDAEQLAYAVSEQKTYFATEQKHYGVILAVRRLPQAITKRLLTIMNHVTADEMENQVRYI